MVILNRHFNASITFHNTLHGFPEGRGTGTASLKVKLIQQLTAMKGEVLYKIFLDLHKEHDALERDICLDILKGYGMGPPYCRILRAYWERTKMVACVGGYYDIALQGFWGVTHGGPLSPTIFNVVMDTVVHHWI